MIIKSSCEAWIFTLEMKLNQILLQLLFTTVLPLGRCCFATHCCTSEGATVLDTKNPICFATILQSSPLFTGGSLVNATGPLVQASSVLCFA